MVWGFILWTGQGAAQERGWDTVVDTEQPKMEAQKQQVTFKYERTNDLPGNPKDVKTGNVWSAPAIDIYNEMREVLRKIEELEKIRKTEDAKWIKDTEKVHAIYENKRRLEERLEKLQDEKLTRIAKDKWYGFVPETPSYEPADAPPPPDPTWGGGLPEVSTTNPTTMGRSDIEKEMKQLNEDRDALRKKIDHLNSLGSLGEAKVAYKAQTEARLKEIVARLKALEAEKKNQIEKGVWGYSPDDITRVGATKEQMDQAYKEGNELAKKLKSSMMTSDEVRQATRDAYERYQNNEKLKEEFKRGFRDGS